MRRSITARFVTAVVLAIGCAAAGVAAHQPTGAGPRVTITFPASAHAAPITGRVYVAISRVNDRQTPIQQAGPTGVPLFGRNVEGLAPGTAAAIGPDDLGHPVASLRDIPAGDYWVAAVREHLHEVRPRRRPHRLAPHGPVGGPELEALAGQPLRRSRADPLRSRPRRRRSRSSPTRSSRPSRCRPTPTTVKRIKIQSQILSQVVGPADLPRRDGLAAEGLRRASRREVPDRLFRGPLLAEPAAAACSDRAQGWSTPVAAPRVIWVSLQHPSPYYDDSYGVNSANNGPYGDAIMQELMPAVESQFRVIARALGAHAHRRLDRRLDRARQPDLLSRLLRRHRSRSVPTASTSATTRSSTSTTTPTPTGWTTAG